MDNKEITTEKIRKKFDNQFELVIYAISLARNMIETGRAPHIKVESENPALRVLAEISSGKDYLEEIVVGVSEEVVAVSAKEKQVETPVAKPVEKKKPRKILVETPQ